MISTDQLKKNNGDSAPHESLIMTAAIHAGHEIRRELEPLLKLTETARLREEDPFTDLFGDFAGIRITGTQSRFEIDLNRPREKAVYIKPEDAWGLRVWKSGLERNVIERSLAEYDRFYKRIGELLTKCASEYHQVIVLDIHSYNYRRLGPDAPFDDPDSNPDINVGTGTMRDRGRWAGLIECCIRSLGDYNYQGRHLDVRENVKFRGGWFPQWIHSNFPDSVCCLSLEVKKFFMDEWNGEPDLEQVEEIRKLFKATSEILMEAGK